MMNRSVFGCLWKRRAVDRNPDLTQQKKRDFCPDYPHLLNLYPVRRNTVVAFWRHDYPLLLKMDEYKHRQN
jgi:hypothetical protein